MTEISYTYSLSLDFLILSTVVYFQVFAKYNEYNFISGFLSLLAYKKLLAKLYCKLMQIVFLGLVILTEYLASVSFYHQYEMINYYLQQK